MGTPGFLVLHPQADVMSLYDNVSSLPLDVEGFDIDLRSRETSSGFERVSTVVSLAGDDCVGSGEDVTYEEEHHRRLQDRFDGIDLAGSYDIDGFSRAVSEVDLFPDDEPRQEVFRSYRRWAFESAALDLALKQADTDLASQLDRSYSPVRFVVSTRLDEPPTGEGVERWLEIDPELEFKLDPTSDWTEEVVERLAATDAVRVLDLKGQYEGTEVDQDADMDLYSLVLEGFTEALVEDPDLTEEARETFEGEESRVTWDYPITGVDSVESLPWKPRWLNLKPSRFGSVESVFGTIDYCRKNEIELYGGGQFELDVGREHLHALASLFYPESPNDVAPAGYNDPTPSEGLPSSPLQPPENPEGFRWRR